MQKVVTETEFIIQQHYKVTVDESAISRSDAEGEVEGEIFHRMFKAIIADEKALLSILEYEAIAEDALKSDSSYGIKGSRYDDFDYDFQDALVQIAHIFTPEDKKWLLDFVKSSKERRDDLFLVLEPLEDCFKATPVGWYVQEHLCERKVEMA